MQQNGSITTSTLPVAGGAAGRRRGFWEEKRGAAGRVKVRVIAPRPVPATRMSMRSTCCGHYNLRGAPRKHSKVLTGLLPSHTISVSMRAMR
ncbi:jg12065 [Pararge aegeria aegeria]|uniref:Jg12065 protein n=1 Tax=Pararge aegeria aegeria TaxID=348720 RepID=A0A8S4RL05_9NEOP|nr:jg12065 [Pararge aegeria aegeria]